MVLPVLDQSVCEYCKVYKSIVDSIIVLFCWNKVCLGIRHFFIFQLWQDLRLKHLAALKDLLIQKGSRGYIVEYCGYQKGIELDVAKGLVYFGSTVAVSGKECNKG